MSDELASLAVGGAHFKTPGVQFIYKLVLLRQCGMKIELQLPKEFIW